MQILGRTCRDTQKHLSKYSLNDFLSQNRPIRTLNIAEGVKESQTGEYWDKTEERVSRGQRSEVRGTTHPRPGRRAERPGEGEGPWTGPSGEGGSAEAHPHPSSPRTGRRQPRVLCRREGVEGGEERERELRIRDSGKAGNDGGKQRERRDQTFHPKIKSFCTKKLSVACFVTLFSWHLRWFLF